VDATAIAALIAAGVAMGFINNLAGAGGVIGLWGLELIAGLAPADANTSLRLGAMAIGIAGFASFRGRGHHVPPRAWAWAAAAAPGAAAGAVLAVTLPEIVYQVVLALVLVTLLWRQLRAGGSAVTAVAIPHRPWLAAALFFAVGLHMGFIQVGTGLVAILALTAVFSRNLVEANTVKMALVIVSATISCAVLAYQGAIRWEPALWLALGCGIGSFAAARWSLRKGHGAVRWVVLAIAVTALIRVSFQIATS